MKKKIFISILIVTLIVFLVAGGTYSYLKAVFITDNITDKTANFSINYVNGKNIEGPLTISNDRSGGLNTTVKIKLNNSDVSTKINMYLNVTKITPSLATDAFHWEVVGVRNSETVYEKAGNFNGITSTSPSNRILLAESFPITTTDTDFTVYFWIDAASVNNSVLGAEFSANISAESNKITGNLN